MALPRTRLAGQPNGDGPIDFAFFPAPSKGSSQHDQFAPSGCRLDSAAFFGFRSSCIRLEHPPLDIFIAGGAGHRCNDSGAEEVDQFADGATNQVGTAGDGCMVFPVFRKRVCDQDLCRVTLSELWSVFMADVLCEGFFSCIAIALARSCADLAAMIEDDPDRCALAPVSKV